MFVNEKICKVCGGECCKAQPGACYPKEFGLPSEPNKVKAAINSGKYCIDWWEGDPRPDKYKYSRGYFVRPVVKGMEGVRSDPTWGGHCTFLTKAGCELAEEDRPWACQSLEPKEEGQCIVHEGSKRGAAIEWLPYNKLLEILGWTHEDY